MSQTLSDRRTLPSLPAGNTKAQRRPAGEHPLEMEARLRTQEADARWRRAKEKTLVCSAVAVILNACAISTFLIVSKAATPADRQLGFLVLGQIIALLVGVGVGKNLKWKG